MADWKHNPKHKNDTTQDPVNGAFFSNETVGNLSNALIREGIQNCLDEANDKSKPVRIRIFLSGDKYSLDANKYAPYLNSLIPHLRANGNGIIKSDLPDFGKPMRYMVFEDFNTKGLEGDPFEYSYHACNDKSIPHNFYYFWRADGRSGKLDGKMGSWGVGKSVFPASSMINSYLAFTIRESDKRGFLIGRSVLKTHNLATEPEECGYNPIGYYANFDDDNFALPEDSEVEIERFCKTFRVYRSFEEITNNTGLSIVIPFYKEEFNSDALLAAVIQQFFFPIMLGKLELELQHEDHKIELTKNTFKEVLSSFDWKMVDTENTNIERDFISLTDFVDWSINLPESAYHRLTFNKPETAYEWRQTELFNSIDIKVLQQQYEDGIPLAFLVPVKIHAEGESADIKYYKAYIVKDSDLEKPESYYIREYLTITGVSSSLPKGVRGMLIISNKELVTFFGQAEGPAHTGWHKDNFRTKYEHAANCISFVRRTFESLHRILSKPPVGLEKDILNNIFYIPIEDEPEYTDAVDDDSKKDDNVGEPDIPDLPPAQRQMIKIKKIPGGIYVYSVGLSKGNLPEVSLKIAYDTTRGNPLKKYRKFDFQLNKSPIVTKPTKCIFSITNANEIKLTPQSDDFDLTITGFDEKRDLFVTINTQYPNNDTEI